MALVARREWDGGGLGWCDEEGRQRGQERYPSGEYRGTRGSLPRMSGGLGETA